MQPEPKPQKKITFLSEQNCQNSEAFFQQSQPIAVQQPNTSANQFENNQRQPNSKILMQPSIDPQPQYFNAMQIPNQNQQGQGIKIVKVFKEGEFEEHQRKIEEQKELERKYYPEACTGCQRSILREEGERVDCGEKYVHFECMEIDLMRQVSERQLKRFSARELTCLCCKKSDCKELESLVKRRYVRVREELLERQFKQIEKEQVERVSRCQNLRCRTMFFYREEFSFYHMCPGCEERFCYVCQKQIDDFEGHLVECYEKVQKQKDIRFSRRYQQNACVECPKFCRKDHDEDYYCSEHAKGNDQ